MAWPEKPGVSNEKKILGRASRERVPGSSLEGKTVRAVFVH